MWERHGKESGWKGHLAGTKNSSVLAGREKTRADGAHGLLPHVLPEHLAHSAQPSDLTLAPDVYPDADSQANSYRDPNPDMADGCSGEHTLVAGDPVITCEEASNDARKWRACKCMTHLASTSRRVELRGTGAKILRRRLVNLHNRLQDVRDARRDTPRSI